MTLRFHSYVMNWLNSFPYVTVITPNLPEVELLIDKKIHTIDDMKLAASCLKELGAKTVVVKGGKPSRW